MYKISESQLSMILVLFWFVCADHRYINAVTADCGRQVSSLSGYASSTAEGITHASLLTRSAFPSTTQRIVYILIDIPTENFPLSSAYYNKDKQSSTPITKSKLKKENRSKNSSYSWFQWINSITCQAKQNHQVQTIKESKLWQAEEPLCWAIRLVLKAEILNCFPVGIWLRLHIVPTRLT